MVIHSIQMFFIYLLWCSLGFALHIAKKLMEAKKKLKTDFAVRKFWELNFFGYLYTELIIVAGCALFAVNPSQIKELPPVDLLGFVSLPWQFYLISFGFGGGSLLKSVLNKKRKV